MIRKQPRHAGHAGPSSPASSRARLLRHGLRVGILTAAIGLSFPLSAQTITGGLYGSVKASKGSVIVVANPATGFDKTVTPDKNGQYALKLLTPGDYVVSLRRNDQIVAQYSIHVSAGSSSAVPAFTPASTANATELSTVQVTASTPISVVNPIDVKTPTLKTTWDYRLLQQLPVPQQSTYAIAMLNSSVVGHDVQGLNLPVSRGAGPTANRYYFNEFDTTYDVTGVGAITFPRFAQQSYSFISNNAPIEFTSTTGGVTTATMRQGNNHFHGGLVSYWTFPTSHLLNPRGHNTYYLTAAGNKVPYIYNPSAEHNGPDLNAYLWGSGPIVKNKLFFFAMIEDTPGGYRNTSYNSTQKNVSSSRSHSGLLNLTWNVTDNQQLDVAGYVAYNKSSTNEYDLAEPYVPSSAGDVPFWSGEWVKDKLFVGNYHWFINDNLTLRLMAGYMRQHNVQSNESEGQASASLYSYVTGVSTAVTHGPTYQPYDYYYAKRGYKGDLAWTLGNNTLKVGAERYTVIYHFTPMTNAIGVYQYLYGPAFAGSGVNGGVIPASGKWGYSFVYSGGGTFFSHNDGYYVHDHWQATPNIVLTGGLRLDQMRNEAANGVTYLAMTTLSPRLGLAWDVHGDSSLKIGATVGKYTLPMPSTLSYYDASATLSEYKYFSYTGINPDGSPIGAEPIGSPLVYDDGSVPHLSAITSQGIKNTYQYEFQVYAQQLLSQTWSLRASANAQTLKNLIDQTCDNTHFIGDYVRNHGHPNYPGLAGSCIEFNPGQAINLRDDLDNNGQLETITIPQSYLGLPAAARHYWGLSFRLTHAQTAAEPYFLSLSYTWSHLYGNSDGYVNTTKGSTNPEPGQSGNYSFPQFTAGNYGDLGEDVRNNFVFLGSYNFNNGFQVGGTLRANTGRPASCLGVYPDASATTLTGEGAVTHYCQGELVPAGSTWRAPFFWQLDLSASYTFNFHSAGTLQIQLNMFNVTNRSGVTGRAQTPGQSRVKQTTRNPHPAPSYFAISGLQSPRYTTLTLRYRF